MKKMKPLIAGNWKMNGLADSVSEIQSVIDSFSGSVPANRDVLICPPFTLIAAYASKFDDGAIQIGGQDCHDAESGAHTGDISAEMLADAGAAFVIVGHSERRANHGETSETVKTKANAALRAGLTPIICVGESQAQRKAGEAAKIVEEQLSGSLPDGRGSEAGGGPEIVVAYEPVWAIGTGLTPTLDDIAEMHAKIRNQIGAGVRILYGGSVKPANAKEILAIENVNGALVGGASLKAADFAPIVEAAAGA